MNSLTTLTQKKQGFVDNAQKAFDAAQDPANEAQKDDLLKKSVEFADQAAAMDKEIDLAKRIFGDQKQAAQPRQGNVTLPEDKQKVKIHATCRAHVVTEFQNREINGMDADHRAYAFGRWVLATAAHTAPQLYGHHAKHIKAHEAQFGPMNAAAEGASAGVYVPEQFGMDLVSNMKRYGRARELLNVLPMFSETRTDPIEGSDPTPTFVGEGVAGSDNTPSDDNQTQLTAQKLIAIIINSSELNEDAMTAYGDSIMRRLANGFANKEDQCAWNGDGTTTYGGMKGFINRIENVGTSGLVTGAGSTWASLTLANFHTVLGKFPDFADSGPNESPDAAWVCHRAFYYDVMHRLMLAQGGATVEATAQGTRQLFLGRPVVFSNVLPATTATNTTQCTYGNHRRAANFGDRRSFTLSFSQEASVGSVDLWSSDQVGIKATERFDIAVHSVGDATNPGPVVALKTSS